MSCILLQFIRIFSIDTFSNAALDIYNVSSGETQNCAQQSFRHAICIVYERHVQFAVTRVNIFKRHNALCCVVFLILSHRKKEKERKTELYNSIPASVHSVKVQISDISRRQNPPPKGQHSSERRVDLTNRTRGLATPLHWPIEILYDVPIRTIHSRVHALTS